MDLRFEMYCVQKDAGGNRMGKVRKRLVSVFMILSLFIVNADWTGVVVRAAEENIGETATETESGSVAESIETVVEIDSFDVIESENEGTVAEEEVTAEEAEETKISDAELATEETLEVETQTKEIIENDVASGEIEASGQCGDNLTWTLKDGTLTISGTGDMWDYSSGGDNIVPWNQYRYRIEKLVLNEGITRIGDYAFYSFGGIGGNLVIPEGVTSIGDCAFYGCRGFNGDLIIPKGIMSIGDNAFYNCRGFDGNLTISEGIVHIGDAAFCNCSGFRGDLIIPKGITRVGWYTFGGCEGFDGNLVIPKGVTNIEECAFRGCSGFGGNLIIPEGVVNIGEAAFWHCSGFRGSLIIPNGVTQIGKYAFSGCTGFDGSLTISEGVTDIGSEAFYNCSGFKGNLTIQKGITSIERYTFSGCSGFSGSLVIPEGVTDIGDEAFNNCGGFNGSLIIPRGVTDIGSEAFNNCSGFRGGLEIPQSVSNIGSKAFKNCSGFTGSLVFPEGIKWIGGEAFRGCSGFNGNLVLPKGIITLDDEIFNNCSGFNGNLIIPEGVERIGYQTFGNCSHLSGKIYIPASVTSINNSFGGILNCVICGISGTYAETYAKENNIPFVPYNSSGIKNEITEISDYANLYIVDDELGTPIEGALVNGTVTNADGYLPMYILEEDEKLILVTADGYNDYMSSKRLEPNGTYYISMLPTDGESKIVYAKATIGNSVTNLLANKVYLQHTSEDISALPSKTTMKIEAKARGNITKYELLWNDNIVASSADGIFSIPTLMQGENTILTNLDAQGNYTIRATDTDGNITTKRIGVCVSPKGVAAIQEEEKTGSFSIGSDVSVTLPKEIPFLGGATASYGLKDALPFEMTIERNGQVKIAINKSASVGIDAFKEDFDKLSSKAQNLFNTHSLFEESPKSFGAGCFSANVTVKGYGEGYIDMTNPGTVEIKVEMLVTGKGSGKYEQYFFAGAIPFYISVEGGVEVKGKATLSVKSDIFALKTDGVIGTLSGKIYLTAKAGVGIDGLVSVGVAGTGACNYVWKPKDDYTKVWLNAWLELRAECFGWNKDLWKSPEATYTIYEASPKSQEISMQSMYNDMISQIYDSSAYTIMDRSYLQKAPNGEIFSDGVVNNADNFLQTYVYPGAEPQMVTVGDRFYLFWLQDIPTRSSENKAAIVYAFSDDGVNFTEPKQLVNESENQTLDNGVDVYTDNGKIYICWQDAAESFDSGISLDEVAKQQKISYAVIDVSTGDVEFKQTVTETAGCYLQPKIYVRNGQVQIAWIRNSMTSADGLWGSDNQESLQKYDAATGTISTFSLGSGNEKIISMDGVSGSSQSGVVYVLDEDGSMQTASDRKVYFDTRFGTGGSRTALTAEAGVYSSPVSEGGNIYWYSDGNISYTTIGSNAVSQIYQEERADIGSEFRVLSEGERVEILWESIDRVTEKVALCGISSPKSGQWTSPYVIEQTDSEMTGAVSGSLYRGIPHVAYMHIKNLEDGSKCYSICMTQKKNVTDIVLEYAGYEYGDFKPGQTLPITVGLTNSGNTVVESVEIKLDGTVLGTETVNLEAGESKAITLRQYTVPADIAAYAEHTLTVAAISEKDMSDNDYTIGIGYTDMKVLCSERLQNESMWFDISVLNDSSISSEATLNIRADKEDGKILYTEELGKIEGGKGISLTVNLLMYEDSCCTYFVEVITGEKDVIEGNNVQFIYTGYGTDIKGGELVREPAVYTVTFQSNGGSEIGNIQVEEGECVTEPEMPVREGYRFKGWYLDGERYDFQAFLTGDIILTAEWEECESVAAPSASIESGSKVKKGTKVSLTCAADGADIYYAIGGAEPTKNSSRFTEPIEILNDMTIKAFAAKEGFKDSETVTFTYIVTDAEGGSETGDEPSKDEEYDEGVLSEDIPESGIPQGLWIAGIKDYTYTGKAIKPSVRVYDGDKRLKEKTDYTISYKNNTKANDASVEKTAPTVIVKGRGNYSGTETVVFKILPVDFNSPEIVAENITLSYNKKVQKPIPVVTFKGKKLKNKTDFTVSYPDLEKGVSDAYKKTGTYNIVIAAKKDANGNVVGNFKGRYTVKLTITDKFLISKASVKKIPNQNYQNGNAIEPELTIKMKGMPDLVEGTDYTVEYRNNTEVGTALVLITGIGKYAGTKKVSFKIAGKPFNNKTVNITGVLNKEYDGTEQTLDLQVISKEGNGILKEGVNYRVSYEKNKNAGTASVIISGINDYSGTIKKKFKITAFDLAEDAEKPQENRKISGVEKEISVKYVKGGAMPSLDIKFNGTVLTEGKDYTVSYKNNKAVADRKAQKSPTIIIKGKGNFKGTLTKTFTIERKTLNDKEAPVTLSVADVSFVDKAGSYKSKPILTDTDGKKLIAGKDYESRVVYKLIDGTELDNKSKAAVGTVIKVIVTGKGNYAGGRLEGTYKITKSDFSKAKISIKAQTYTGKGITLDKNAFKQVKAGGVDITDNFGTDYEIVEGSYRNNVKKGTASVTIKGKGNYGGTKTVQFKIRAKGFLWWWRN